MCLDVMVHSEVSQMSSGLIMHIDIFSSGSSTINHCIWAEERSTTPMRLDIHA
jgi:hypothetical protein